MGGNVIISGTGRGVGKALAEHFYKKNYKLVLVGGSKEKVNKQSKKFKKNTLFQIIQILTFP